MAVFRPLAQIISEVERLAPPALAASWDEVGLRWGDPEAPVGGILLAIDLTAAVLAEARARGAQLVLAYHPPLWRAAGGGTLAPLAQAALAAGVAVYSSHTAWDAAAGGANDQLAAVLGLAGCRPLVPHLEAADPTLVVFVPPAQADALCAGLAAVGCGRIGDYRRCSHQVAGEGAFVPGPASAPFAGQRGALSRVPEVCVQMVVPAARVPQAVDALRRLHPYEEPVFRLAAGLPVPSARLGQGRLGAVDASIGELAARLKARLQLQHLLLTLPPGHSADTRPGTVAVVAGAGGELWRTAHRAGANLLVTGEVRHHDALAAAGCGVAQLATLHSHSERGSLVAMAAGLRAAPALCGLPVWLSQADTEPQAFF